MYSALGDGSAWLKNSAIDCGLFCIWPAAMSLLILDFGFSMSLATAL